MTLLSVESLLMLLTHCNTYICLLPYKEFPYKYFLAVYLRPIKEGLLGLLVLF